MSEKNQVHLEEIKNIETVLYPQDESLLSVTSSLETLVDNDIDLALPVDLVDLDEAQNPNAVACRHLLKHEPSLGGVMNVLLVEVLELADGFERLLEEVVHRLVVIMELVQEKEVCLFERS